MSTFESFDADRATGSIRVAPEAGWERAGRRWGLSVVEEAVKGLSGVDLSGVMDLSKACSNP